MQEYLVSGNAIENSLGEKFIIFDSSIGLRCFDKYLGSHLLEDIGKIYKIWCFKNEIFFDSDCWDDWNDKDIVWDFKKK